MRRITTGIVLFIALMLCTYFSYAHHDHWCEASIDCEDGIFDPTADCEANGDNAGNECFTFVEASYPGFFINAYCPGDRDPQYCDIR